MLILRILLSLTALATIPGVIAGGFLIFMSFTFDGAPQQAAAAAVGLSFMFAPYALHGLVYRSMSIAMWDISREP